jgi:hypothetical protein
MKKDSISDGLMKMPWADLAGILVTKDDLRGSGWSEAKIKRHLGQPHGRHPSTHFRNPLGQPYWNGQQVVAAAVRAGYVSRELKDWPYQVPVHGLRDCGNFIMALEQKDRLVMHPEVDKALRYLVKIKADLTSLAVAKPRLAELNALAEPGVGFGKVLITHLNVRSSHFPPHLPASECVDFALWVYGEPEKFAQEVVSFADLQMLLSELQMLPDEQDVIDVLTADIESKANRFEDLDTAVLARLCGIEPADGDANRTTFAYWFDIEMQDELHQQFAEMEPYVSPKRFAQLMRWAERIDEMESEFDMKKLTKREQEVLALLWNTDGCSDRSFRAVCSHTAKSRNGDSISFEFFVGDGGDIEDSCGPYNFKDPGGINCDDPDEIEHPETRNRLVDLLYKPRKPKAK